jgi:hypothetical protein
MEYSQGLMMAENIFPYKPGEHELEKASNSYLMSLVVLMCGLPLPIVNLIASIIFALANRKGTYFVRWHCTQVLLSQLSLFPFNSIGFWWTVHIAFYDSKVTSHYLAYIFALLLFNFIEFVATLYTAIQVRKGHHVVWFFYGALTNVLCKP